MTVIRNTQTVVQVAYTEAAKVRVSQHVIKILYSTGPLIEEESVSSALTLTQEAVGEWVEASPGEEIEASASNALTLSDIVALNWDDVELITQSMTLVQTVSVNTVLNFDLEDTLEVVDEASAYINRRVGDSLFLVQIVALEKVLERSLSTALTLTSVATYTGSQSRSVSSAITLTQLATRNLALPVKAASNALVLTQAADYARPTASVLNLQQIATGVIGFVGEDASSTLSLSQTVAVALVWNASISQTLTLTQTASKAAILYADAESTVILIDSGYGFNTGGKTYVLLQAPVGAIEAAIVLPNAIIGDTQNITSDFDLKIAMDGTKRTYLRTTNDQVLRYTFRMNRLRALALLEFVETFGADLIRMTNWKGEVWHVYLTTNPVEFVETSRGSPCGANTDVDLEFTGVKISG
jgi:hypothetical protein